MRALTRFRAPLLLAAATIVLAGCDSTPTLPDPDPLTQGYEIFTGPLDPGGRNVYLITLAGPVNLQVTLAGTIVENPIRSVSQVLTVEIGTWDGSDCVVLEAAESVARFSAAVHRYMTGGTQCVAVADKRGMPQQLGVVLRVDAPPILGIASTPGTQTFSSTLTPSGRATQSFEASTNGTATVMLTSLSPSNAAAGLAIGVQGPSGAGCVLALTATVQPGGSLSAPVAPGFYCAAVFDVGNFTTSQTFGLTITRP